MRCCISGEIPREPVVSKLNGCLYEKRLIEQYLAQHGRCPKTGEPMRKEDLVLVTGGAPAAPRPTGATSIPGLLSLFQAEWDALMLEQYSLRQQLASAQQELSQALFQHDAACRVIAKLMKERDELKAAQKAQAGDAGNADEEEEEEEKLAIPERVAAEIDQLADQLKANRTKREIPRTLAPATAIQAFVQRDSHESHSKGTGTVPVTCIAVNDQRNSRLIYSGGADGKCICYDGHRRQVAGAMVGHTKSIRGVCAVADFVVSCSDDSTTRVWRSDNGAYHNSLVLHGHQGAVMDVAVLPTMKHALTGGTDGYLILNDLYAGLKLATKRTQETSTGINRVGIHPDGFIALTASAKKCLIWDIKMMNVEMSLTTESNIACMALSQDGFTIAAGTTGGVVQMWDLRNLSKQIAPIQFDDSPTAQPSPIGALAFDDSGSYLAIGTHNVKVLKVTSGQLVTTSQLVSLNSHTAAVTGVAWGTDAQWLASSSLDRQVKIYGHE
jgi:pre-mRNA-processing factor 19